MDGVVHPGDDVGGSGDVGGGEFAPARWLGRGGCQGGDGLQSVVRDIPIGVEDEAKVVDQVTGVFGKR